MTFRATSASCVVRTCTLVWISKWGEWWERPYSATAPGYVSRIKVSTGGYGNALYVQHPNGTTSVYAHLHEYNEDIQRYVKKAQYQKKSFTIELFPGKNELSVKRGEVLGKAGNSGSSGGPHLHFEIRDANQRPIDPLQYNFKEIVDRVAPYVRKISLTTLDLDSRINGQFGRFEFAVTQRGDQYTIDEPIDVRGTIGVEIAAYDKSTGVRNIYGVKRTELRMDGEAQYVCEIDRFSFAQAKNIHVHTNYEERYRQNRTFYKLYVDDGNDFSFYTTNDQRGALTIRDAEAHPVSIALTDINGNEAVAKFTLQGRTLLARAPQRALLQQTLHHQELPRAPQCAATVCARPANARSGERTATGHFLRQPPALRRASGLPGERRGGLPVGPAAGHSRFYSHR